MLNFSVPHSSSSLTYQSSSSSPENKLPLINLSNLKLTPKHKTLSRTHLSALLAKKTLTNINTPLLLLTIDTDRIRRAIPRAQPAIHTLVLIIHMLPPQSGRNLRSFLWILLRKRSLQHIFQTFNSQLHNLQPRGNKNNPNQINTCNNRKQPVKLKNMFNPQPRHNNPQNSQNNQKP